MTLPFILSVAKATSAAFYLLLILVTFVGKNLKTDYNVFLFFSMLSCPVLLMIEAGTVWAEASSAPYARFFSEALTFSLYFIQLFMLLFFGNGLVYVADHFEKCHHTTVRYLLRTILLGTLLLLLSNPFTHIFYRFSADNSFSRGPGGFIPFAAYALCLIIYYVFARQHVHIIERIDLNLFSLCVLFVLACSSIQLFAPSISLSTIAIAFSVMVMCISQSAIQNKLLQQELLKLQQKDALVAQQQEALARQEAMLAEQKETLIQNRITLMRSQIKPHFIFNSLSVIRSLIAEDPDRAVQSVASFTTFLQKSLDMLDSMELISFENELELVRSYLYLEQMRFPGMIDLQLKLEIEDFMLPALTIQPLVENAIKYGIRGKNEPGTVTICTTCRNGTVTISIHDDGVGFDVGGPVSGKGNGTALENIRNRLALLCEGSVMLNSIPGLGTTVVLQLPEYPCTPDAGQKPV